MKQYLRVERKARMSASLVNNNELEKLAGGRGDEKRKYLAKDTTIDTLEEAIRIKEKYPEYDIPLNDGVVVEAYDLKPARRPMFMSQDQFEVGANKAALASKVNNFL